MAGRKKSAAKKALEPEAAEESSAPPAPARPSDDRVLVQVRMGTARGPEGPVYAPIGGGIDSGPEAGRLRPGDQVTVSRAFAERYKRKLCAPGSQVEGERVKPDAECDLEI